MGEYVWGQSAMWNASKLQIPKAADWWLPRAKLLSSIESGDEGAVVFHAGAGFGKTTVMAEWAARNRTRSCWYRLHESDNHFFRFLYGIATALSGAVKANLFDADGMKLTGREKPDQVSELFFSRCIPALPDEGVFICLDDFQVIHDEAVQDFLLRFMEYGEGRARFFFSLRGGFPAFLAACLMRGAAREIKENELRFEEDETAQLLDKISGRKLPQDIVRGIYADMCGWPAGTAFAGLDLKEARTKEVWGKEAPLFDRTRLYDYIFYEIFRKLAYDTQQFLAETSVLETMKPSLCNYVTGREDAAGMLRYLVRENLFLSRLEGEEEAYRYDSVFRGFLRGRLAEGRREEVLLRAAEYEVRRSAWEEAVHYGMQCGEKGCALVAAVFEKQAAGMEAEGQCALLRTWIDHLFRFRKQLPDTALFSMYEYLYRGGDRRRGEELLVTAAGQAYAKLCYDRYERYMCELAAVTEEEYGHDAAEKVESEARQKLVARGITMGRRTVSGQETDRQTVDRQATGGQTVGRQAMSGKGGAREAVIFVQCLRSFSVCGPGGEAAWRTKKTKELFACLFYERGGWVTRDVLMERLWPEKAAEKAAVLFHTTASYLRKALAGAGGADCLLVKNQSYALKMEEIRSDIEELDICYEWLKNGKRLMEERADGLVALYGRGYLYEEDYLWSGAYREEVEQRYLWMLKKLADGAFGEGRYTDAVKYLKKTVEVDGYALSALERLVECLIYSQNIAGAKKVYERLQDASGELFGEEPERAFEDYLRIGKIK